MIRKSSSFELLLNAIKPYPLRFGLTLVLGFSSAVFSGISTTLIVPVVLAFLGQDALLTEGPPVIRVLLSPFEGLPQQYQLPLMAVAIILAIALKNLTSYIGTLVSGSLARALISDLRESGIKLLLEVDLDYYSKTKVGDLVNRLGNETARTAGAINALAGMFSIGVTLLFYVFLLLSISWQLTLVTTALMSLVFLMNQFFIRRSRHFGLLQSKVGKNYSVALLETLSGIRLIKGVANEGKEYQKLVGHLKEQERAAFMNLVSQSALQPINEVVSMIAILLIVFVGRLLLTDQIDALSTVLLTYLFLLFRMIPLVSQLNNARSKYANVSPSVDVVQEFLRRHDKPFMVSGETPYTGIQEGIRFNHISFAYPDTNTLVLEDINLFVPRGTTLALVGGSGAGKSTLADLVPRFYDPSKGSIQIDQTDLRDFDIQSVRRAMGIVSQDTFLFNASVRDNIAYAVPEASDEEILRATERANAYEFIGKLSEGFDTMIGDRGVLLSGGQRQRISIARALLQDPEILILDEATSALDTVSERLVQDAIDNLSRDRTTIVIAHRLSTVEKADQIAVMEKGQVIELGTHDELLRKGGQFAKLYSLQFADEAARDAALVKSSYEVRSQLNPMIGFLRLLLDDMVDTPEEQEELIWESYHSAIGILNKIEFIEENVKLRNRSHMESES
ncbi:MAG: ABC transporter ATP-binding protein [Microcoleaceae cyanobacterium]